MFLLLLSLAGYALAKDTSVTSVYKKPSRYNTTSSRLRGVVNVHFVPHTHDE